MSSKRTRRRNKEKRPQLAESRNQITGQPQQSLQLPARAPQAPKPRLAKIFEEVQAREVFPARGLIGDISQKQS